MQPGGASTFVGMVRHASSSAFARVVPPRGAQARRRVPRRAQPRPVAGNVRAGAVTLAVMLAGALLLPVHATAALTERIERVSESATGAGGDRDSFEAVIAADRPDVVAFSSAATNLAPDDNDFTDVFLDEAGTLTRISGQLPRPWRQLGPASQPSISADGRVVAFSVVATDETPTDSGVSGEQSEVFVHDRRGAAPVTTHVSPPPPGCIQPSLVLDPCAPAFEPGAGRTEPSLSPNGRYVAYNDGGTVRLYDRQDERHAVVAPGASEPAVSDDGVVAFVSGEPDVVTGDVNGARDVFVHYGALDPDPAARRTERVSVGSAGEEGNGPSFAPSISADGRVVAFQSYATTLVPFDGNGTSDVFVRDLAAGTTELVSSGAAGVPGAGFSTQPAVSADGRYVAFASSAPLVAGDVSSDPGVTATNFALHVGEGATTRTTYATSLIDVGEDHVRVGFLSPVSAPAGGTVLGEALIDHQVIPLHPNGRSNVNPIGNKAPPDLADGGDRDPSSFGAGAETPGPDLVSAELQDEDSSDIDPYAEVRFCFDESIENVRTRMPSDPPGTGRFLLQGYDSAIVAEEEGGRMFFGEGGGPNCLFAEYRRPIEIRQFTIAVVPPGAVEDVDGNANVPSVVALGGSVVEPGSGHTTGPDLELVRFLGNDAFLFHFDEPVQTADHRDFGYALQPRPNDPPSAGAERFEATSAFIGSDGVVEVTFPELTAALRNGALVSRFIVRPGGVTDFTGQGNPLQVAGLGSCAPNTTALCIPQPGTPAPTTAPDLVTVTQVADQARLTYDFTFDEPVEEIDATRFWVYPEDRTPVSADSVERVRARTVRAVFPLAGGYGRWVVLAAAVAGAVMRGDAPSTSGTFALNSPDSRPGLTDGPDLVAFEFGDEGDVATFLFDEPITGVALSPAFPEVPDVPKDVFVRDRQTGRVVLASVDAAGRQVAGDSARPSLSRDGRYVVFDSDAAGLVPADTSAVRDVFRRDLLDLSVTAPGAFPGAEAGGGSAGPRVATVRNTGFGRLVMGTVALSGPHPGDFVIVADGCSGRVLLPQGTCEVAIAFVPVALGPRSATLTMTHDALGNPAVVGLRGRGFPPSFAVAPDPVGFGSVGVGVPGPTRDVRITNVGTAPQVVGPLSVTGAVTGDFAVTADGCAGRTLAPGESCVVTLRFSPTAVGSRTASLTGTFGTVGVPLSVGLVGTGLPPRPVVTPNPIDFGSLEIGDVSSPRTVTVTNAGEGVLKVGPATVRGPAAADFSVTTDGCSGSTLRLGESCTVVVRFTPSAPGPRSATLSVPGAGEVALAGLSVPGEGGVALAGQAPAPVAAMVPNPLVFGAVEVGTSTGEGVVTVTNRGGGRLALGTPAVAGAARGDFAISGEDCAGRALGAGESCTVRVRFTPSAVGGREAALSVPGAGVAILRGTGLQRPSNVPPNPPAPPAPDPVAPPAPEPPGPEAPVRGPSVQLSPNMGPPGTVTLVDGGGFSPNAIVELRWTASADNPGAPAPLSVPVRVVTDGEGRFRGVPILVFRHDVLGPRTLLATPQSPGLSATASFLVVPSTVQPSGLEELLIRRAHVTRS